MNSMYIFKQFLRRLLIVFMPLFCFYLVSLHSIAENSKKIHRGDVGLGLAVLLFFILAVLLIGFCIDFIYRIRKKQYKIALTDVPFLLLFIIPFLYIHCQMGGCCANFCEWYVDLFKSF